MTILRTHLNVWKDLDVNRNNKYCWEWIEYSEVNFLNHSLMIAWWTRWQILSNKQLKNLLEPCLFRVWYHPVIGDVTMRRIFITLNIPRVFAWAWQFPRCLTSFCWRNSAWVAAPVVETAAGWEDLCHSPIPIKLASTWRTACLTPCVLIPLERSGLL